MQIDYNFFNALKWNVCDIYIVDYMFPAFQKLITELHLLLPISYDRVFLRQVLRQQVQV
jgi:hypothetical protein